jgi:hypothetical protein
MIRAHRTSHTPCRLVQTAANRCNHSDKNTRCKSLQSTALFTHKKYLRKSLKKTGISMFRNFL